MVEDAFGDPAEFLAGREACAGLRGGMPVPLLLAGKSGQVHAALEEEALLRVLFLDFACEFGKRVLEAVVHLRENARAEFGGEQVPGELYAVVDHEFSR